jgi:DNA invertase Pin-like site-specific DNA recombinase
VSAARVRYGTTATSAAEVYGLGYARISGGKEQRDSALSIPAQDHHIRTAMEREGVVPLDSVSDILKGTRSDRPGYQRLLAMVRRLTAEGKQVAVFIFRLDRFGRDPEERSRAWKELAALGVRLYAIQSNGWVTERFLYDLDAALSQREVTLVGERVCAVNDFVRGNGCGRQPPRSARPGPARR